MAKTTLFIRKPMKDLISQADHEGHTLKRTLGPTNLILLGIGAIIGAGLFQLPVVLRQPMQDQPLPFHLSLQV